MSQELEAKEPNPEVLEALRREMRAEMETMQRAREERGEREEREDRRRFDRDRKELSWRRRGDRDYRYDAYDADDGYREDYDHGRYYRRDGKWRYGDDYYLDPRLVRAIRGELEAELRAADARQRRASSSDPRVRPYVNTILKDLMELGEDYGLDTRDLMRVLSTLGRRNSLWGRLLGTFQTREGKGFAWGMAATFLGMALWPKAKENFRPAARRVMEGAMVVSDSAQEAVTKAKEELEDLLAEARFEQIKDGLNQGPDEPAPAGDPPQE